MNIEQRAISILSQPESYPLLAVWPEQELVLRMWRYPSFSAYSSWLLREKHDRYHVRRLEWDKGADAQWPHGEPTIYGSETCLAADDASSIIRSFRSLVLPPFVKASLLGLDGVVYGVETKSSYLSGRLVWWYKPPDEWAEVGAWYDETVKVFERALPKSTARKGEA